MTIPGIHIRRVADGKIVEDWWSYELMPLLEQLGVIPADEGKDYSWGPPSEVTGDPGDPETNKQIIRDAIEQIWNRGNMDAFDEYFSEDFVSDGKPQPLEPWAARVTAIRAAFPDFHATIEDMVAEGDKVVHRLRFTGTHQEEFMGVPPTGVQWAFTMITISRIADGKDVQDWGRTDILGWMEQLGVVPPMTGRTCFTWGCPRPEVAVESRTWGQIKSMFK